MPLSLPCVSKANPARRKPKHAYFFSEHVKSRSITLRLPAISLRTGTDLQGDLFLFHDIFIIREHVAVRVFQGIRKETVFLFRIKTLEGCHTDAPDLGSDL